MRRRTFKSLGAIVVGLLTIVVLATVTDTVLETTGVFPSVAEQREHGFDTPWMVLLALAYRAIFTVAGGYVTAALAPGRPMRHAVTLGLLGIVLSVLGAIPTWGITPIWFSIVLILLALPCAWLGGRLRTINQPSPAVPRHRANGQPARHPRNQ